jgi:hypothetical protein
MNQLTNLATQIEQAFQQVLHTDADTLARQTGFIQRQRKLTGADFAQILLTTVLETPLCPPAPTGRKPQPYWARPSPHKA